MSKKIGRRMCSIGGTIHFASEYCSDSCTSFGTLITDSELEELKMEMRRQGWDKARVNVFSSCGVCHHNLDVEYGDKFEQVDWSEFEVSDD